MNDYSNISFISITKMHVSVCQSESSILQIMHNCWFSDIKE